MDAQQMVNFVVFALSAWLGMWLTRRIKSPRNRWIKIFFLVLLIIAPAVGMTLINVVFAISISAVLQGLVFGLVAGWWAKR